MRRMTSAVILPSSRKDRAAARSASNSPRRQRLHSGVHRYYSPRRYSKAQGATSARVQAEVARKARGIVLL